jgi:hypothetical protein
MLDASNSTFTREFAGSCSSTSIVPSRLLKRPRTVVNIMCLTANSTVVCAGSIFQVVLAIALILVLGGTARPGHSALSRPV